METYQKKTHCFGIMTKKIRYLGYNVFFLPKKYFFVVFISSSFSLGSYLVYYCNGTKHFFNLCIFMHSTNISSGMSYATVCALY